MVRLISITPNCENTIVYCARVSSSNQENPEIKKLIEYCARNGHWSIFEMGNMIIEVEAPRYITAQILRHRSFSFQEFSQRYAKISIEKEDVYQKPEFRARKETNRQSSMDIHPQANIYQQKSLKLLNEIFELYKEMTGDGVAPETARTILPMCTMSKMYINGTIRSWIHYLQVRCDAHSQKEHQDIANQIKNIFKKELPIIYESIFE
jgi:thymidylate synthase (FAD)